MIRNIVLVKLKPGTTDAQVDALRGALAAIPFAGRHNPLVERDLGLVDETMDLVITADFDDEPTYQAWFADPAHNRVRRELLLPISERSARIQYRI
ncbi:MAG: Dabb family protein [Micromonosporaceae bacterium]|nr:Dabb family protein [Micromonosporaceae bacterium]